MRLQRNHSYLYERKFVGCTQVMVACCPGFKCDIRCFCAITLANAGATWCRSCQNPSIDLQHLLWQILTIAVKLTDCKTTKTSICINKYVCSSTCGPATVFQSLLKMFLWKSDGPGCFGRSQRNRLKPLCVLESRCLRMCCHLARSVVSGFEQTPTPDSDSVVFPSRCKW